VSIVNSYVTFHIKILNKIPVPNFRELIISKVLELKIMPNNQYSKEFFDKMYETVAFI